MTCLFCASTLIAAFDAQQELLLRKVRAEERERCARIAESLYDKTYWDDPSAGIAASIRKLRDHPA